MKGDSYIGFPLLNFGGSNSYQKITLEECQLLCQITDGCLYFGYNSRGTNNICSLKYGMGQMEKKSWMEIGPKFCPGI